jgi:signal transduction histidine kinase
VNNAVAFLILTAAINIFISLLVLFRNYKKPAHIAFAVDSIGMVAWATLNFLSTYLPDGGATLPTTRATGFVAAVLITGFYVLSTVFPNPQPPRRWFFNTLLGLGAVVSLLCATGLFVADATLTLSGLKLTEGPLYSIYIIYILGLFVLCNVTFVLQYRRADKFGRAQIKLMGGGFFLTVALIILSNMIMPALTADWSSSKFGTIFILPFVGLTAYAILKGRMFDIRLVLSRTIAYAITISGVAAVYALILTMIAAHFVSFGQMNHTQIATLVIPAIFIALTFSRVQAFIDRWTKSIFYRDAYDLRDVLDKLSDALLSENDISPLMTKSLDVLTDALKPTTAYLAVFNTSGVVYKQVSIGDPKLTNVTQYMMHMRHQKHAIVESEDDLSQSFGMLLRRDNVDLVLRLGSKTAPIGLLILGPKRSGSKYTAQDISLLKIGAKNLAIALDNAKKYEQIIHFADTLHKEVRHATSRLRKANDELKTLDALKDDFISAASHQLRTPAVSVHDALHMLNMPSMSDKDREELLGLAEGSSERLVNVVRTMLNMARIQAGHFTIDTSEADFVQLVDKELDQLKVLATQRYITLDFKRPSRSIIVQADIAKLNEAVANYIENAIKYSLDKTIITISLRDEGDSVRFEVADQGMGVPPQERADLFGRFYRASNARKQQPDGNGIGLYVVKSIAEGHGGEVYYRPGKETGSIFGFVIKKRPPSSKRAPAKPRLQAKVT